MKKGPTWNESKWISLPAGKTSDSVFTVVLVDSLNQEISEGFNMKMWKCQCCNPWVMNAWFSLHAAHTEGNMLNGAMYNFIYNIKRLLVLGTHCLYKPFLFQCPFFCTGISLPSFLWMKEGCNNDIIMKKRENFQTSCSTHTQKKSEGKWESWWFFVKVALAIEYGRWNILLWVYLIWSYGWMGRSSFKVDPICGVPQLLEWIAVPPDRTSFHSLIPAYASWKQPSRIHGQRQPIGRVTSSFFLVQDRDLKFSISP